MTWTLPPILLRADLSVSTAMGHLIPHGMKQNEPMTMPAVDLFLKSVEASDGATEIACYYGIMLSALIAMIIMTVMLTICDNDVCDDSSLMMVMSMMLIVMMMKWTCRE